MSADDGYQGDPEEERNPETFDDAELYQQLLKEFLETSAGSGGQSSGIPRVRPAQFPDASVSMITAKMWCAMIDFKRFSADVQGPKRRKSVDRRASKGRKLRFHVQEKLVNFMTPAESIGSAPTLACQLFNNLFGSSSVSK